MKEWLKKLLSVGDEVSSKRTVGVIGAIILYLGFIINAFVGESFAPSNALVDAVLILSASALGITAIEKIRKQ